MASKLKGIVSKKLPVVVIIGATGTGKSKLAIEIAKQFNGEIISADSMQVYKGLDIITNKVTEAEQEEVPHHVIDYVSPLKHNYTVHHFRDKALPIIDSLLDQHKLPVIVGGTNYYIEALLWKTLLTNPAKVLPAETEATANTKNGMLQTPTDDQTVTPSGDQIWNNEDSSQEMISKSHADAYNVRTEETINESCLQKTSNISENCSSRNSTDSAETKDSEIIDKEIKYDGLSNAELYERLGRVDPITTQRLHPNNRRKVIRALEVYEEHGSPLSHLLDEQHSHTDDPAEVRGPLRYADPCLIWIQTDQTVLDGRIDRRVDQMIAAGLLDELEGFHQEYNLYRQQQNRDLDYTLGIFQSIGFKEFHEYLMLPARLRETDDGRTMFQQGVEQQKQATRKYSRKQVKWIRGRFLKRGADVPPVYAVDSSQPENWLQDAHLPAMEVVNACIKGEKPNKSPLPKQENEYIPAHNVCQICGGRIFVTKDQWEAHLKSNTHKKRVASRPEHRVDEALRALHRKRRLQTLDSSADDADSQVADLFPDT